MKNTAVLPPVQSVALLKKSQINSGAIAVSDDDYPVPETPVWEEAASSIDTKAATVRPFRFPFFVRNHDLTLRESSIY